MFLPSQKFDKIKAEQKAAFARIEQWTEQLLDDTARRACTVSVQEIKCTDPTCSPIDTLVQLFFDAGEQGMIGLPMEATDVELEILKDAFPPKEIIDKWVNGEEAEWPAEPEPVELRFSVGTKVLCRVGPNDWTQGTVEQLWYRQSAWQEDVFAPYKVRLRNGSAIYAPQDVDPIIRLDPEGGYNNEQAAIPG